MKKVLILNGSFCEVPIIKKAKELGYYVVTTGNMPNLVGHQYADEYIPADYSDKEAILKICQENDILRIISCANDFGVLTSAYVAEKMGWPGHDTYENAMIMHHKDLFKKYCIEKDIPSPRSLSFTKKEEALNYAKECEYPIIVKANDLTGGKGILHADNVEEAVEAIENAYNKSRDKKIIVEPYIIGKQQSFTAFVIDRKVKVYTSNNCLSIVNPYLIQAETLPAEGIDQIKGQLISIIESIVEDLDLKDGILCLQYIVRDGQPYIIEMMRRCFGNQFLTLSEMFTGFPWHEAYIRNALGESISDIPIGEPELKYCGHFGVFAPRNGKVVSYKIPEDVESHVFKRIEMVQPGGTIDDYMNQRIVYLYYKYDNYEEMLSAIATLQDRIEIEME